MLRSRIRQLQESHNEKKQMGMDKQLKYKTAVCFHYETYLRYEGLFLFFERIHTQTSNNLKTDHQII